MIAVDTNLLVYAHREDSPWHEEAREAVRELAEGASPWAIPWPCIHEFLAIATHPRIFSPPTPLAKALDQVEAWLESPSLHLLSEQPRAWESLRTLLIASKMTGPAIHDARIANLCLQHGIRELWTADRDFSRFRTLRVRNPLA
ncbi:MAG TPA: TA system VapC family ribonuclease toxin [Thermoanaerobaculia bacterium]|nr:TA system VapC family ribonuclease toxin [Thermoanaerobaculia bacterium]